MARGEGLSQLKGLMDLPKGLGQKEKEQIVEALKGLTWQDCEDLLPLCLAANKRLDLHFIRKEKAR